MTAVNTTFSQHQHWDINETAFAENKTKSALFANLKVSLNITKHIHIHICFFIL